MSAIHFYPNVAVGMSAVVDGSMSKAVDDEERLANRRAFLKTHDITAEQTMLVHLTYEGDDYRRYYSVSTEQQGDGIITPPSIVADALFTKSKSLAFLLPVADCIGAVLYDVENQAMGLAHLGRHNLVQEGGKGIVEFMATEFGSNPADISVWMSPAAGRESYPLYDFDNRSLHEVALEQLMTAGIDSRNVTIDRRDTARDSALFSHSEFLKGNRATDGRQAVVCMMRP